MIPGWSHPGEFEALARYASRCPGPWVEIGSYCGRSTRALGEEAAARGVTVFAVDPHRGNPEMAPGRECHHPEVWARENGSLTVLLETVSDLFNVVPVVCTGSRFAESGIRPGFVFIDADHDYEAVKQDFTVWSGRLLARGVIALHDAEHSGPARVRDEAVESGWTLLEQVASLAVLKSPQRKGAKQ